MSYHHLHFHVIRITFSFDTTQLLVYFYMNLLIQGQALARPIIYVQLVQLPKVLISYESRGAAKATLVSFPSLQSIGYFSCFLFSASTNLAMFAAASCG